MLSIVNGQPRELGLVPMLKYFIEHRVEVVRRRTEYELRKAREREHILLGFRKALDHLDEVIKLIRPAKTPKEAISRLGGWFTAALQASEMKAKLSAQGLAPVGICGAGFAAFLRTKSDEYARVIRAAGMKAE